MGKLLDVCAYYRVSTKGQGDDDKLGLPMQRQAVEAYCAAQGHRIVATFEDVGHSGATADRPGLAALLAAASAGLFAGVVVYRWDRLARDTMLDGFIRYGLTKHNVRALSATETNGVDSISKLTQQILASVAEYERSLITQRLSTSRKLKALAGGYAHGRPPYGWKALDGELVEIPEEQKALAIMRALRTTVPKHTFAAIAAELNARGIRPRSGDLWQTSSVHYALTTQLQRRKTEAFDRMMSTRLDAPDRPKVLEEYAATVDAVNDV
jgi:site-specific DNA recombinase